MSLSPDQFYISLRQKINKYSSYNVLLKGDVHHNFNQSGRIGSPDKGSFGLTSLLIVNRGLM